MQQQYRIIDGCKGVPRKPIARQNYARIIIQKIKKLCKNRDNIKESFKHNTRTSRKHPKQNWQTT